jgi:hypothetical protein
MEVAATWQLERLHSESLLTQIFTFGSSSSNFITQMFNLNEEEGTSGELIAVMHHKVIKVFQSQT